jgi:hypothetical protein
MATERGPDGRSNGQALMRREEVAEGTIAFHFERPPPDSTSIASPPFANELLFTTQMRDTAFKRSLKG